MVPPRLRYIQEIFRIVGTNSKQNRKYDRRDGDTGSKSAEPAFRFLVCDLSADEKRKVAEYADSGELAFDDILVLVSEGYKFSLANDSEHHRFVASITDKAAGSPFRNCCLTSSGSTALNAVRALLYKHMYKLNADWANVSARVDEEYG